MKIGPEAHVLTTPSFSLQRKRQALARMEHLMLQDSTNVPQMLLKQFAEIRWPVKLAS